MIESPRFLRDGSLADGANCVTQRQTGIADDIVRDRDAERFRGEMLRVTRSDWSLAGGDASR